MFSGMQTSTVVPLCGRGNFSPVGPSDPASVVDKELHASDSSDHNASPPPPITAKEGLTDSHVASTLSLHPFVTPMMRTRERACFQRLVMCTVVGASVALFCVWCGWRSTAGKSIDPKTGRVIPYTFQYFIYCLLGGIIAGTVHVLVTPIDVVKCRVQVGEYRSFKEGFLHLYYAEADGSVLRALPLFFRGWVPTVWGYCIQGALKFSLYEAFKYMLLVGPLHRKRAAKPTPSRYDSSVVQVVMILLASLLAEAVADVGLAPWEAVKIRIQTTATFSANLRSALPRMWETEGLHGFYKGLVPLWCRQVPYTMVKFASFEMIVVNLTLLFHAVGLLDPDHPRTLGKLAMSLMAGMLAGVLCGLVSHPADTVLSKLNQKSNAMGMVAGSSSGVGGTGGGNAPLLASTIAASRSSSVGGGAYSSSSSALHDIVALVRDLGWRGLWKGLAARLLMVSMLTALQWAAYDSFKVAVGLPTSGGVAHK